MINQALACNPTKTRRLGENFHTIDFDLFPTSKTLVQKQQDAVVVGELYYGLKRFKITYGLLTTILTENSVERLNLSNVTKAESEYILDTLQRTKTTFFKKISLGR